MATRTREEETAYRRELRKRKAVERSDVAVMSLVPADSSDESVLGRVQAEIDSMGEGARTLQGQGAVALQLAKVLDQPALISIWPATAAQLRSTLLSMRAEAKASAPALRSKLTAIRDGRG